MHLNKLKNRYQAFAYHLMISALIALAILYVCLFQWYPQSLFYTGGTEGLAILLSIDLILGPVLTLIVFKPFKKGLKWDLSIIAAIQIVCLLAGLYLVYNEKPDMIVLTNDGAHIISRADRKRFIETKEYEQVSEQNSLVNNKVPFFIAQTPLDDPNSARSIVFAHEFANGRPYAYSYENYYLKADISKSLISQHIQFINEHFTDGNEKQKINKLNILKLNDSSQSCEWTPVRSNHFEGFGCINHMQGIVKLIKNSNKSLNHDIY